MRSNDLRMRLRFHVTLVPRPPRIWRAARGGGGEFGAAANDPEVLELVETANTNGVEPHAYLTWTFERLSHVKTIEDFEGLAAVDLKTARRAEACRALTCTSTRLRILLCKRSSRSRKFCPVRTADGNLLTSGASNWRAET